MPKPIKKVSPIYPEYAKKMWIEGSVVLAAKIGEKGDIIKVEVKKSLFPDLDKSAINALKQWKFSPAENNGKPVAAWIMVPFDFALDKVNTKKSVSSVTTGIFDVQPKVVKEVNPIYPEEAKKSGIEGTVVLATTVDKSGNVTKVKVKKSLSPALDKAAMNALKQWKFAPAQKDKKAIDSDIVVPIKFSLDNGVKTK